MTKRNETLDIAKGLLIILVVFSHSIQYGLGVDYMQHDLYYENYFFKSIYTFHMPLFMMISGFLFYYSNNKYNLKTLLIKRYRTIGIPLFSFVLLTNVIFYAKYLYTGSGFLEIIGKYISDAVCGYLMWFLPSILLNVTIISLVTRSVKSKHVHYLVMTLITVLSFFIPDTIVIAPHKFMFPFFCMGYIIAENKFNIYRAANSKIALFFLTACSIAAICWYDRDTYIYTTEYCILDRSPEQLYIDCKRYLIGIIVSYTAVQFMFLLERMVRGKLRQLLVKLGNCSLFIYGFNISFNTLSSLFVYYYQIKVDYNILIPIIETFVFLYVAVTLYIIMNKNKYMRILFLGK